MKTLFAAALVLPLVACSAQPAEDDAPAPESTPAVATSLEMPPSARPRQGLEPGDVEAAGLAGELACSFTERDEQAPLLVAMADVRDEARAEGVLKLGPSTLKLRAAEPGGFNAMVDGERFVSGELVATVTVTADEPLGGGESPPRAAALVLVPEGLPPQQIEGRWTCGP